MKVHPIRKASLFGGLLLLLMGCTRSSGGMQLSDEAVDHAVIDTLTYCVKGIEFRMFVLSGGRFEMGATTEQPPLFTAEYLPREVQLMSYAIGETEVTQVLWLAVMGDTSTVARRWTTEVGKGADYPAYGISYADYDFCGNVWEWCADWFSPYRI
ncbi:secreted protein containing Sulphatase-modifying factor domain protein [gut metagenome]|uniref:Secreted protein containing Sulphatase-modifying factor domain protein n=1 Tax=gut metagenome TaxID=749906 RepID=J9CF80_9ZZZZ